MFSLKSKKQEFHTLLWAIGLMCFTIFVFAPTILYLGNQADMAFSIIDFLPYILVYGICVILIFLLIGWILPKKCVTVLTAVIFAVGLALYLQGNFLNADYGVLDGRGIKWNTFGAYPYINSAIWILLIAGCIVFALMKEKTFRKVVCYVAGFLILVQGLSLAVSIVSASSQNHEKDYSVTTAYSTTLSKNNNTIVLIVDACDTQYFQRMLDENQEIVDAFDGFTYFADFAGSYSKTKMGLPFLLTEKWYENQDTVSNFIKDAYKDVPLYQKLKENNYNIGIYTSNIYLGEDVIDLADNVIRGKTIIGDHWGLSEQLMEFSFFAYFPHVLKPYFEFYSGAFQGFFKSSTGEPLYARSNYAFQKLCKADFSLTDENAFRFFHITGSHLPCNMDENGNYVGPWNADAYHQTLGVFKSVKTLFESMKEMGIYDNSTIFVTADHGRFDEGLAFPLMLVKRPNEHGRVKVSNAPASQSEFHATILKCAGIETDGESFYDIGEDENRERRFLYYPTSYQNGGYLPVLTEYMIGRGLTASETGLYYTKDGVKDNLTDAADIIESHDSFQIMEGAGSIWDQILKFFGIK